MISNFSQYVPPFAAPYLPTDPTAFLVLLSLLALLWGILRIRTRQLAKQVAKTADVEREAGKIASILKAEHNAALKKMNEEHATELAPFKPIQDVVAEADRLRSESEAELEDLKNRISEKKIEKTKIGWAVNEARTEYNTKLKTLDKLNKELAIYDSRIALAELGVYEPHFDFGDSEAYKSAIVEVRNDQKALIKGEGAVVSSGNWTVDGSQSKGKTMTNRAIKLALRAFNNECDAAIAAVRWNNAVAIEKRIERARSAIDKLNISMKVAISETYYQAKLKELRLTHEYRERLKQEKDERAELARSERDEKRLQQEALEARKEEERYEALLERARAEAGLEDPEIHRTKIAELELQLAAAHQRMERAQAMAEMTKSGFVYVISNIGSFGEDVVKIGMTRRLDPMDRVKELGDASVPFLFDTHAMIYSDDAPALESALHKEFAEHRINTSNMRKEFFKASIGDVQAAVKRLSPQADFHTDIEAQEFYETLAKRKELSARLLQRKDFPATL